MFHKIMTIIFFTTVFLVFAWGSLCHAEIKPNLLANAIYRAENSSKHPYGILAHYKHTTPRQACLNTISHALADFKGQEKDFIAFLGSRYCPIGSDTDNGTCRYWVKNVTYFYEHPDKGVPIK